jgi:Tol biopolymer transport system component
MAVFLRDTVEGTTTLLNVNRDGLPTIHDVYGATMSGDARLFAYFSFDGNIVPGDDAECGPVSCEDLFVFDREMGTTTMVPLGRSQGLGGDFNMGASSNGRYIALGHDDNLLLYDNETKVAEPQLTTIDGEAPNGRSFAPSLSADGRFIAFVSRASNLVPGDTNEQADVFVLDRASALMERVSLANDGTQADGPSGSEPAVELVNGKTGISADGRFVTFASASANLGNEPLFECQDYRSARLCYQVYLHDRDTGTTEVISKGGDNDSLDPAISADGQFIVFTSMASNLTANALPSCEPGCVICCGQIYLFDREANQLHMLTAQANAGSWGADLSGNGRYITFTSLASNLVAAGSNGQSAIYRYDRDTDQFEKISVANLP